MQRIQKSEKIFHGCFNKNEDGTKKLIEKGRLCFAPTNNPFWKHPQEVPYGVRTRSQEKEQKKIKIRDYDKYFQNLSNIQKWIGVSNSEMEILNESDEFYVMGP